MAQNITLLGASYSAVPAVKLPKTGGGTADFTDVSDTTAAAADVASGKYFYTSAGVRTQGTASGGGGGATIKTATATPSSNSTSISFSNLSAKPLAFSVVSTGDISRSSSSTTRYVVGIHYDGSTVAAENWALTGNRAAASHYVTSNISQSYSNGTLTIGTNSSTTGGYFYSGVQYKLIYVY